MLFKHIVILVKKIYRGFSAPFFSLDVEGAEFAILQTIPWDKVDIQVSHKISTRCQRYDHVISGFGWKEFSIKILL